MVETDRRTGAEPSGFTVTPPAYGRSMTDVAVAEGRELLRRQVALEGEVAAVAGVLNAAQGRMVLHAAELLADPFLGLGEGVHTPALYLAWKAGMSSGHARDVARVAKRLDELPCTVAALCAGELSLDQATVIARYVPAAYDESAASVGRGMTVAQLRRTMRRYGYDADLVDADDRPAPVPERSVITGTDEVGWWGRLRLSADVGAVVDQAIRATTDDLRRQASLDGTAEGAEEPDVVLADGVVAMAEAALRAGEARFPGSDRYLVHVHLEAGDGGEGSDPASLSLHLGDRWSRPLRRRLLCDPKMKAVLYRGRVAIGVGRTTRHIGRAMSRIVQNRDGGCAVPGCGARHHLEVHHIVHWEDGGVTETANLVTLCRKHHRAHHEGLLDVAGNPDQPAATLGALAFRDHWGRPMAPCATPMAPDPSRPLSLAAVAAGLPATEPYKPPYNERLSWADFFLQPNLSPRPQPGGPQGENETPPTPDDSPAPTRAGPA